MSEAMSAASNEPKHSQIISQNFVAPRAKSSYPGVHPRPKAKFAFFPLLHCHKMGKVQKKGQKGAAKAYMTRSAAVKKLQCSLADFRRLCILKGSIICTFTARLLSSLDLDTFIIVGIFPREPRHKKRANKGSTAPTSFYYTKDIAYIAHEPILGKLREHKAFAKKLARALGRGEWSSAKSLEEHKPTYTLDHVIKER